jgi:hypothetical protein
VDIRVEVTMSDTGCPALTMLSTFLLTCLAAFAAQQPSTPAPTDATEVQDLLQSKVLIQGETTYVVQDVLNELYPFDASLKQSLESNAEYLGFYVNSLRFYDQVRWFSNKLILDQEGYAQVSRAALEQEGIAWATARSNHAATANSSLAQAALEIQVQARLIAKQPDEFSNQEIRTHFNKSIPEFFGSLKVSWIRVPLFDLETNTAINQEQRMRIYEGLDKVGKSLSSGDLDWEQAVKDHSLDPVSKRNGGRIGYLKRNDNRFDESFMRQLFWDFGITTPDAALVRGPIIGSRWVYLVRIERVKSEGVVELSRVKDRVIRSLRLYRLHTLMAKLASKVERTILLPISTE